MARAKGGDLGCLPCPGGEGTCSKASGRTGRELPPAAAIVSVGSEAAMNEVAGPEVAEESCEGRAATSHSQQGPPHLGVQQAPRPDSTGPHPPPSSLPLASLPLWVMRPPPASPDPVWSPPCGPSTTCFSQQHRSDRSLPICSSQCFPLC